MDLPAARMSTKSAVSDMPTISPTDHPSTSPSGSRVPEHMPLYPSCVRLRSVLSREHWRMALSELGKIMLERTRRIGQAWAVLSYYTDQLMTPCSKHFSGGSTLNGTLGGDRRARVLYGQMGWLSEPLHRVDADCSGCTNLKMQTHRKNTKKNPPHPKHHESHSSPVTVTTSRWRAKTHVSHIRPYSAASIDPGFVEIGFVQLSPSAKNDECYTHIHTDQLSNGTLYAPRYEEAFLPKGKKRPHYEEAFVPRAKNGLGRFASSALPSY